MVNLYYKKDILKSIEELLYGLYVYQYFLDTSTMGLILRYIIQDQILSLKTKASTLRIALYAIAATSLLALLRHLHKPARYAAIIDFIGNVSTPSRSKLLWVDILITLLQVTSALVLFNIRKSIIGTGSSRTRPSIVPSRHGDSTPSTSTQEPQQPPTLAGTSSLPSATPYPLSGINSRTSPSSSSTPPNTAQGSSSQSNDQASSVLFEYPMTDETNGDGNRDNPPPDYYVDEEETRFSVDNPRRSRTSRTTNDGEGGSGSDSSSESGSDDDEDDDPLRDGDYEEILEQETFVLQLRFKDMVSYLMSNQEAFALPRIPDPRSASTRNTAAEAENNRVQNLPV
ncbi:hypothetical protein BGZ76_008165 [Entomortierella beljakovae]|nr:hypothetical protein BGZ76_008165 [Entomortierella beljakovae]